jgi:RecJ-like exonuclease
MEGEQIARVKCRTCGSEHKYREKKKKRVAAKKGTSSVKKEKVSRSPEKLWEAAMMMVEGADIPYDMSKVYSVGDIIDHRTFGKGVVQSTMCKKVGILFKDKERLLVSGNK